MDAPVNGSATALHGPNGMYHPVQPTDPYGSQTPHHGGPPPGYHQQPAVPGYQYPAQQTWAPQQQQQQQQKPVIKKNSRAHVVSYSKLVEKLYFLIKCEIRHVTTVEAESRNATRPSQSARIVCKKALNASIAKSQHPSKLNPRILTKILIAYLCANLELSANTLSRVDRNLATIQDAQRVIESRMDKMSKDMELLPQIMDFLKAQHSGRPLSNGIPESHLIPLSQQSSMVSEPTEREADVPEQAPGAHSTGAQHLSKKFPLTKTWFKAAGVESYESYPYELESARGTPRLFGSGWSGDDPVGRVPDANSIYNASYEDSHPVHNKGGLNPNGSLRLDQTTVKRLTDSYMRNMWVIYPIFDAEDLKQRVAIFCSMYSPDDDVKPATPPNMHYSAHSPLEPSTLKRSFSEMQGVEEDRGYSAKPKRPVDYSLNNAIILLVLALGKLCEHEKYIMSEEIGRPDPFPEDNNNSQGSSPPFARPSSTRSSNNSSSPKFPNNLLNTSSHEPYIPATAKNVLKLPGLGYYAEAVSMLGHCIGRRGLDAVHAHILTGLYWGQMGYILQSADCIHMAANSVVELLHTFPVEDITAADAEALKVWNARPQKERDQINLFLIAFWTVQQMEGDILAELERLPSSRLGTYLQVDGKDVRMPADLVGVHRDIHPLFVGSIDVTYIHVHFLSQLTLRKYLNRAHLALYSTENQKEAAISRQRSVTWADLDPDGLWQSVQVWRDRLPENLRWSDTDEPASDILQARLRAKYYGFVYIVSRKILENVALNNEPLRIDSERLKHATLDELQTESMKDVGVGCKRCILAAMASTVAFDNTCDRTKKRARLPNIMGTFTA
jgi:hypothetical protein